MPGTFHIRHLQDRDLDRIEEIEQASFAKDAYDRKLFAEYRRKCGELFLVVLRGTRICGYMITCARADCSAAEVISLAVDPDFRGHGAASALIDSTLRRLRRRGIPRAGLMVKVTNVAARRFYEKWGFRRVRRVPGYYEDGKDGIRMRLEL
ncbi:MAG TPA: GNAT family N-acetyltransferase [Candidatus Sulfopaludibacter sp.]|nr:GNAT family N-acetyltransferase [Candidatus Sulfopaludibacter sp.]